ncbi:hypothetical protein HYW73_00825 [Candidatus Nomurabacteria bacterium]|nr:hypothetical protein [Candidatus Nomurabacteria bacterium]
MEKYFEHSGKVVEAGNKFEHVMAISLDPRTQYQEGVIRCITNREGDVTVKGYVDRSELYKLKGISLEHFEIVGGLKFKNEKEILNRLIPEGWDFIGFEDPDIWIDPVTDLMHLYFTIPVRPSAKMRDDGERIKIHLGHAVGHDLDSLEMTMPVLMGTVQLSAKEVSIAPLNSKGFRYNLIESRDRQTDTTYSIVKVAIAEDMGKPWKYGEIRFHSKEYNISWIGGHASPGPLLPKSFIDVGEGKLLGIINGREANQKMGDKIKYGIFSIGLFIYDYENGKIDWVSPEPLIRDSEAKIITFASQFVETGEGEGILYAHVDDSFVRAYTLKAESLKSILPAKFVL